MRSTPNRDDGVYSDDDDDEVLDGDLCYLRPVMMIQVRFGLKSGCGDDLSDEVDNRVMLRRDFGYVEVGKGRSEKIVGKGDLSRERVGA